MLVRSQRAGWAGAVVMCAAAAAETFCLLHRNIKHCSLAPQVRFCGPLLQPARRPAPPPAQAGLAQGRGHHFPRGGLHRCGGPRGRQRAQHLVAQRVGPQASMPQPASRTSTAAAAAAADEDEGTPCLSIEEVQDAVHNKVRWQAGLPGRAHYCSVVGSKAARGARPAHSPTSPPRSLGSPAGGQRHRAGRVLFAPGRARGRVGGPDSFLLLQRRQ